MMKSNPRVKTIFDISTILLITYIIVSIMTWAGFHFNLIRSNHAIWGNNLGDIQFNEGGVSFAQRVSKDLVLLLLFISCSKGLWSLKKWYEEVFVFSISAALLWSSYINSLIIAISGIRSFFVLITIYLYLKKTGISTVAKVSKSKVVWTILLALTSLEILFANAQLGLWVSRNGLSSLLYYRAFGTFPTVFELCDYCTGISFFSSALIISDKTNKLRNWILLFLSIALTLYTGSRSAILAGLIIVIVMLIYRTYKWDMSQQNVRKNQMILDILLILILMSIVFVVVLPFIQDLIGRGDLATGQERSEILLKTFSAPLSTVMLGNGLGRSSRSLAQLASYIPNIESVYIMSDSTINFFMIDLGIVGCVIFFLLSIPFCRMILKLVTLHPLCPFLIFPPIVITALARNLLELYVLIPLIALGLCICIDARLSQNSPTSKFKFINTYKFVKSYL